MSCRRNKRFIVFIVHNVDLIDSLSGHHAPLVYFSKCQQSNIILIMSQLDPDEFVYSIRTQFKVSRTLLSSQTCINQQMFSFCRNAFLESWVFTVGFAAREPVVKQIDTFEFLQLGILSNVKYIVLH